MLFDNQWPDQSLEVPPLSDAFVSTTALILSLGAVGKKSSYRSRRINFSNHL
jgi:hypothetical protein